MCTIPSTNIKYWRSIFAKHKKRKKIPLFSVLHVSKSGEVDRPYSLWPTITNQESFQFQFQFQFHLHFLYDHPMAQEETNQII
jgi:hypothetical protein